MNSRNCIVLSLFAIFAIVGYASTEITDRDPIVTEKLPRPNQIWVYDFVARASDLPPDSVLADQHSEHSTAQSAEEIEAGRKMGAEIAKQLVEQIRLMGMPAERASKGATEQINDILIRGYLISVDEGSKVKRLTIGFGSGGSELSRSSKKLPRCSKVDSKNRVGSSEMPAGYLTPYFCNSAVFRLDISKNFDMVVVKFH